LLFTKNRENKVLPRRRRPHRGVMTGRDTGEEEAKRLWVVPKQKMLAELKEDEA